MSDVKWSEWIDWERSEKPGWMHSETQIQVENFDGDILGLDKWNFKAKDCEWSEIKSFRHRIEEPSGIYADDEEECIQLAYERMNNDESVKANINRLRYTDKKGSDWIDEFAATATVEEFRGAMKFTIGKYNRRAGKKDELIKEIEKMRDYCDRWIAYERSL